MKRSILSILFIAALLTACQSSGRTPRIANGTLGPEVNSICFTRQINDWHPHSNNSFILRRGLSDHYLVEVMGVCQIRDAFAGIQLNARTGTCLTVGDTIRFRNDQGLPCTIGKIYEWHLADTELNASQD
jgi:hypothetical protein